MATLRTVAPSHKRLLLVLVLALLLTVFPAQAALAQSPVYRADIVARSGAIMGTATFTPLATGGMRVSVEVSGFEPVGGDHRLAITSVGNCCTPTFRCQGSEVAVLPNIQFYPDGSADYEIVTDAISTWTLADSNGSSIIIYADTSAATEIIACGVIVSTSVAPPVTPPQFGTATTVTAQLGLKMRNQPDLAAGVILILRNGETVYPSSEVVNNQGIQWVLVGVNRGGRWIQGWVSSAYLASFTPAPPPQQPVGRVRVTAAAGLRLRSGPGLGYRIQRIVPRGTLLNTTGATQAADGYVWQQVYFDGVTLWAASQFLQPV